MCENPYPYMCSECTELLCSDEEIQEDTNLFENKINISSGEDVILV